MDEHELTIALRALPDDELRTVVREATAARPGLVGLHSAASGAEPSRSPMPASPDVPAPAQIQGSQHAMSDYTDAGVPTFDRVRDRVQERLGRSIGSEELDRGTPQGESLEEQWQARRKAGHDRLEEIRRSMQDRDDVT